MIKKVLKKILNISGFEVKRITATTHLSKSSERPVGLMSFFLEDLKARGLHCTHILDIGANRAQWSRIAKKVYTNANFYLIEPQIEMKSALEEFCFEFGDSKYYLAGAGARKETLNLTIWDDFEGSSFLPPTNPQSNKNQRKIEIIRIDDLLKSHEIEIPQLIKLDIQGFELEALKGSESTFGITEVYIIEISLFTFNNPEVEPSFADVINFMLKRGYVVYDFPGFLRRPLDGALGQCDICFVKENGFLKKSNSWN